MRRAEGRETFYRLLEWDKGQAASERLAALILEQEGFRDIDPSHPLGEKMVERICCANLITLNGLEQHIFQGANKVLMK